MQNLTQLGAILGWLMAGYMAARLCPQPQRVANLLSGLAINLVFPTVILRVVPNMEFTLDALYPLIAPWMSAILGAVLVGIAARRYSWSLNVRTCVLLLAVLGNTGFLGVPMTKAFLSPEHLAYAVVFDQLGTFLILATVGTVVVAVTSQRGDASARAIVKKIVLFPPFFTLAIAVFLPPTTSFPTAVLHALQWVGLTIVPLSMLSIGMQFKFKLERRFVTPMLTALSIKMLAFPLVVFSVGFALNVDSVAWQTATFEAAMPPMVTAALILIANDIEPKLTTSILGFGTLVGVAGLCLFALVIGT